MATESDLRDVLREPDPKGRGAIDLDAVLSRSRRRRRGRVIAAQALGSVALVGVLGTAIVVTVPPTPSGILITAEDAGGASDATAPEAGESTLARVEPACGEPIADEPSSEGLTLEMQPITTTPGTEPITVTVVLRNDGPTRLVGVSAGSPQLTLSLEGVVVWHSATAQDAVGTAVDLEPGESMTYEATLELVVCGSEDDLLSGDPEAQLPAAGPGTYELRAALAITPDDAGATGERYLATSPAVAVEIR